MNKTPFIYKFIGRLLILSYLFLRLGLKIGAFLPNHLVRQVRGTHWTRLKLGRKCVSDVGSLTQDYWLRVDSQGGGFLILPEDG